MKKYTQSILVGGPHERRLLNHLFIEQKHNKLERPAQNDSETVPVNIDFSLQQIIDFVSEIKIQFGPIVSFFLNINSTKKTRSLQPAPS